MPVGEGWAQTSVNTVIFRRDSIVSHGDWQVVAYYDPDGHVVLAERKLGSDRWRAVRTKLTGNVRDAHNAISLGVDGAGVLHLAWDHHGHPLRYTHGAAPRSLKLAEPGPMVGALEQSVTYPEFHRLPSGDLVFLYRDGASGRGNLVVNRYSVESGEWERLHDNLIDGQQQRNAYWQACVGADGALHLSWVWRESWDVATNHDLCYAKSTDGGLTWSRSDGAPYGLPITLDTAEVAWPVPQASELINQTSMTTLADGRPVIATYWSDPDEPGPQYRVVFHDGQQWRAQQVSQREAKFTLSGGGTKRIPISRPLVLAGEDQVHVLFRDNARGALVSVSTCDAFPDGGWVTRDLTDSTVGQWEPTHDSHLWRARGEAHLFVQRVGQGDGEQTESLPPQEVSVLEWRP